ncbi:MAG: sporulation protein YabP [Firmicutes bacterium]|nr:sporulation protein YabP [Bacillota bacterium]
MNEEKKSMGKHSVRIENREKIVITGVVDVSSFDDERISAETNMGYLTVEGVCLHINKLNLDSGELSIDGEINSFFYNVSKEPKSSKGSLFSKMFR